MTKGKRIVILGAAESGVGAALLAKSKGYEVFVSDKSRIEIRYKNILINNQIAFEEEIHSSEKILNASEIIKSPGIPDKVEIIRKIKEAGIPVISEIEFASRFTKAKIIAITGTNGKTTTTLLIYHLLKTAGLNVGLGGNVGESFAKQVIEDTYDYWVLEMSSFQLDNCYEFKPYISILLNITPDHLDRYEYKFENYIDSKFRLIQKQQKGDYFIYNSDSLPVAEKMAKITGELSLSALPVKMGKSDNETEASFFDGENLIIKTPESANLYIKPAELTIQGKHNIFNAICAIQVCRILAISEEKIKTGLKSFPGVTHRLEKVAEINGVQFINDSKGTNVDAVYYALDSFELKEPKIIWIAGGVDKGNDYSALDTLVEQKVKKLILLGTDNSKFREYYKNKLEIYETQSVQETIQKALEWAITGDIVLLSPACASFDLFKNYEDRGEQFKKAVLAFKSVNI